MRRGNCDGLKFSLKLKEAAVDFWVENSIGQVFIFRSKIIFLKCFPTHLAVIARSYHAVSISVVGVSLHLRVHSVIVVWLLLRLLHHLMAVGIECGTVTCDDADLLVVLVRTS